MRVRAREHTLRFDMQIESEADAIRNNVDDLAQRCACIDEWRLADARLFAALVEGAEELEELHVQLCELAQSGQCLAWVRIRARAADLREMIDDLRVLRMCVQSRILELSIGAQPSAF